MSTPKTRPSAPTIPRCPKCGKQRVLYGGTCGPCGDTERDAAQRLVDALHNETNGSGS